MAFECYAIYSAVICTALTFALAFNLTDEKLEWLARKTINISFLIYGPVLTAISIFGCKDLRALSHMCTINGIQNHTNFVNLFVLFTCLVFGLGVTVTMVLERSLDIAQQSFNNSDSIVYQLTAYYFQFSHQNRQRASRERRRENTYYGL